MFQMYKAGLLSVGTVLLWALMNVSLRYCILEHGCDQFAIACSNAVFCGLALIAIGNYKINVWKILKNYQTWLFGLIQVLRNVCMISAFVYISSTQSNLLTNIEIVFSVLFAWIWLKRRPSGVDFFSMFFIIFGCFILVAGIPYDVMGKATMWVLAASVLSALHALFAEIHPDNRYDLTMKDRFSVTGWIMFVSGLAFILFFALLSLIANFLPEHIVAQTFILQHLPKPSVYFAWNNLIGGFVTGVFFYAISMYFYLYAVSISTSEYFMMYRSTQAVFTYIVEIGFSVFTALPFLELNLNDWFAAVTIILSSLCMILMRTPRGEKLRRVVARLFNTLYRES